MLTSNNLHNYESVGAYLFENRKNKVVRTKVYCSKKYNSVRRFMGRVINRVYRYYFKSNSEEEHNEIGYFSRRLWNKNFRGIRI